jgi:hypothetical protein
LIARVRSDLEVAIAQEGGITLLVSLAQRGTDGQKEQAARALGNLAVQNAENKVAIAQAGGIELLVTLVERGTDGQKEQAAGALVGSLAWDGRASTRVSTRLARRRGAASSGPPTAPSTSLGRLGHLACRVPT